MISYSGLELVETTPELSAWVVDSVLADKVFTFSSWQRVGVLDPFPNISWLISRPVELNTFYNPWGASRWGVAYGLVDGTTLDAIRALAYADDVYTALEYVIDDDDGHAVATDLWMLTPIPMSKFETDADVQAITDDLWLIVLVDDRYFWWERAAAVEVVENTTTWAQVFSQIATGLGISLTVDTISADYLKPGVGVAQGYDYLPLLLDMAAESVGQRVVRLLDGSFATRTAESALALVAANATLYDKIDGGAMQLGVVDDG